MPVVDDEMRSRWMQGLVRRWEAALLAYAERFVGEASARDVVQETFLGLWRSVVAAGEISDIEGLRGYVYQSCRNRCIDLLRTHRARDCDIGAVAELIPPGFAPREEPQPDLQAESRQKLWRTLERVRRLPARDQEVLRLKLVDGLSYAEIGVVMALPIGTVGWVLHEALEAVKAGVE